MSTTVRENLNRLASSIQNNYKRVENQVLASVREPNKSIVVSIAKYKEVLDKLSKE
jgi:hypothetical protein